MRSYFAGIREELANDCYGVGAGFDHRLAILECDSTDRYKWLAALGASSLNAF